MADLTDFILRTEKASYIDNLVRVILFPVIKISNLHYASVFNTPINRRLQTMAIAILIFLFLAGAQVEKISRFWLDFEAWDVILMFNAPQKDIKLSVTPTFLPTSNPSSSSLNKGPWLVTFNRPFYIYFRRVSLYWILRWRWELLLEYFFYPNIGFICQFILRIIFWIKKRKVFNPVSDWSTVLTNESTNVKTNLSQFKVVDQ